MNIDKIFENPSNLRSFEFNNDVCKVFDDMVSRSVRAITTFRILSL